MKINAWNKFIKENSFTIEELNLINNRKHYAEDLKEFTKAALPAVMSCPLYREAFEGSTNDPDVIEKAFARAAVSIAKATLEQLESELNKE